MNSGSLSNRTLAGLISLLITLLLLTAAVIPVYSQTEEEMEILRMYFKEDQLVVSSTRTPKLLSQVAENITIVTEKEIRAMNAHTVIEVLSRVPGIYISFYGNDFGSDGNLQIQGSEARHVLVLLDGIPWNDLGGGEAITQTIPVGIIKRIEVVKGPASSAWGSSLGGVINIVTKDNADSERPSGSVYASYGERNTQDYRAEVSGLLGKVGYYLYAGFQESSGLRYNRDFNNHDFYGKVNIPFSSKASLQLTAGYSEPDIDYADIPSFDLTAHINDSHASFATASFSADLSKGIRAEANVYTHKSNFMQKTNEISSGNQYFDRDIDNKSIGGSAQVTFKDKVNNAVIGIDISKGEMDKLLESGPALQAWGSPAVSTSQSEIRKKALFINNTLTFGNLSVTPGVRYDYNNIDGDFVSPSLGVTYLWTESTIIRLSAAQGFTTPPLSFSKGGGLFLDPNPDLNPEKVKSYQAGIESWIVEQLHGMATYFHHDMEDALVKELFAAGPPTFNDLYFNKGQIKRDGIELELRTAPIYNISAKAGFAYVHKRMYFEQATSTDVHSYNASIRYDDEKLIAAQMDGRYLWWDAGDTDNEYDTMIWDLNLSLNIPACESTEGKVFFTAHNVFNGSHYTLEDRKNPGRWVEGGIRISF